MKYKYVTMFCETMEDADEFLNNVEEHNISDEVIDIVGYSAVGTNNEENGGVWITARYQIIN